MLLESDIKLSQDNIQQTTSQMSAQIEKMQQTLESTNVHPEFSESAYTILGSERLKILEWLSTVPYTSHHKRISEGRLAGTAEWLFDKEEYLTWRSLNTSKLLLLWGIRESPHASFLGTSSRLTPI